MFKLFTSTVLTVFLVSESKQMNNVCIIMLLYLVSIHTHTLSFSLSLNPPHSSTLPRSVSASECC